MAGEAPPIPPKAEFELPSLLAQGVDKSKEANEVIEVNDPLDVAVGGKTVRFLPYYANAISCVSSAKLPVLSGPFSGCIMGKINEKVYHVSTSSPDQIDMTDCKGRWKNEKGSNSAIEFVPSDFTRLENKIRFTRGTPDVWKNWGLFLPDGDMFALITERQEVQNPFIVPGGKTRLRVMEIIPVHGE